MYAYNRACFCAHMTATAITCIWF